MEDCKALSTPGVKETTKSTKVSSPEGGWVSDGVRPVAAGTAPKSSQEGHQEDRSRKLDRAEMRGYRSGVARCNYLASDRFEIALAITELCRAMPSPTEADMHSVKRMCRFLKGLPRMVQSIPFTDSPPSVIRVYVDSDWAGCRRTRKSTSGGVLYFGKTAVRGWSSNQAVIAMSSGEVEYCAALKGASAALGFQSMLKDLGMKASVTRLTDSSAARGIIHRAGLGRLRHLQTGYLWLQAAVAAKRLQIRKVAGAENPADLFTKRLSTADMWKHLTFLDVTAEEGRSSAVPGI